MGWGGARSAGHGGGTRLFGNSGQWSLGEPLRRQRREFERWTERIVTAVGVTDPVPATRALMALADGLLLHRLTVDPALDMRPAIERAVRALAES
jgi:hypothetical protein